MNELWTALIPAITLAVGVFGTLATESLRDSRLRRREEVARVDGRRRIFADRRDSFELDNLIETHRCLNRVARAATQYHLLDLKVAKATQSDYASHQLGSLAEEPELGEELRLANEKASASIQLVLDDDVRGLADKALSTFSRLGLTPRSVEEANRDWGSAAQLMRAAQTAITDRIRSLYKFGEES